jgi:hypothetical protein
MMLIGLIAVIAMLSALHHCQHAQMGQGFPGSASEIAECSSYQAGTDWAYFVLVAGAAVIVIGVVCSTAFVQSPRKNAPS